MAIEGFDYKEFAQSLAQQALELLPPDFNDDQKNYVANTLLNFSTIAGEALCNDPQLNFNADQAIMITQIIAEWSFHKSVDLIRSGIPRQYWDAIMQKIAFTIFEIAKNAFSNNLPQEQCLQLIEHHVKKTYLDCIVELKDKNLIDEGLMEFAANQSNIDAMVQQQTQAAEQEQLPQDQHQTADDSEQTGAVQNVPSASQPVINEYGELMMPQNGMKIGSDKKILKLATLAMLFKNIQQEKVQTIINKFNPDDAGSIIKFMRVDDLNSKVDAGAAIRCLQEIKTCFPLSEAEITSAVVLAKIQNVAQYLDRSQLEQKLRLERPKVKRFVFTALEGEYYDIPPRVANIIATHIEDSV